MMGAILASLLGYACAGVYIAIVHRWLEKESALATGTELVPPLKVVRETPIHLPIGQPV